MDSTEVRQLLVEIRDLQQEHLAEYRRVTQESLEMSRRAISQQEKIGRLYQRVVAVGVVVLFALCFYLAWSMRAFR